MDTKIWCIPKKKQRKSKITIKKIIILKVTKISELKYLKQNGWI